MYISNPVEFPEVSDSKMKVSHVEEPMSKYWPSMKGNESPLMNVQKLMPLYLSPTACIPCNILLPWLTVIATEYIGPMMDLCARYRGVQQEYRVLENSDRAVLRYTLPLSEIVTEFFSELKSQSSGFASFDYEEAGYEKSNLVKVRTFSLIIFVQCTLEVLLIDEVR